MIGHTSKTVRNTVRNAGAINDIHEIIISPDHGSCICKYCKYVLHKCIFYIYSCCCCHTQLCTNEYTVLRNHECIYDDTLSISQIHFSHLSAAAVGTWKWLMTTANRPANGRSFWRKQCVSATIIHNLLRRLSVFNVSKSMIFHKSRNLPFEQKYRRAC